MTYQEWIKSPNAGQAYTTWINEQIRRIERQAREDLERAGQVRSTVDRRAMATRAVDGAQQIEQLLLNLKEFEDTKDG